MNISRVIAVCFMAGFLFISCDNGDKQSLVNEPSSGIINVPVSDGNPLPAQEVSATAGGNVKLNPKHGEPGHRCEIAVGAPLNSEDNNIKPLQLTPAEPANNAVNTPTTATNSLLNLPNLPTNNQSAQTNGQVKLNPKHGEAGHRCDIAVGAPLNGSTAASVPPSAPSLSLPAANTTPTITNPTPSITNTGNAKLNPKHGEPGHRCDIQVGAPLTSAAPASQQAISQPLVKDAPIGAAALPALQLPNTGNNVKGKVNPKHGEPGHRCDIAVGASLN